MSRMGIIPLLGRLAARNLWLYRMRSLVIFTLLALAAWLGVVGLTLLQDIQKTMRESITGSLAGELQIYSNAAKDDLAIFGGNFMGRPDIGSIPDFAKVVGAADGMDNIEGFVPMGMDLSLLGRGNELDDTLDSLREALKTNDPIIIKERKDQLRFQLEQIKRELTEQKKLALRQQEIEANEALVAKAEAPGFLDDLNLGDEGKLQFLETKIAPISGEKAPIYLNYVGTDIDLFRKEFPKFVVEHGTAFKTGQRGILVSRKVREDFLKNLVARQLDRLNKRLSKSGLKIAGDAENTRIANDLPKQYPQIMAYLDRGEAEALSVGLKNFGIAPQEASPDLITGLTQQLKEFLKVDDSNFFVRYAWFYEHIAPLIKLYEISPGEIIALRSYTRSGYMKSLPLKVFGVYTFSGLEDSDLAGAINIIDLVSFRELFGQMTEASRAELGALRAGVREIRREDAEEALFGGEAPVVQEKVISSNSAVPAEPIRIKPVIPETFDPHEIKSGLALSLAVRLKDPNLLATTQAELSDRFKERGFDLRVVDWRTASGIAGQFVMIVSGALIFSLAVIFVVALVIINNSIVVSSLHRTREIGTMRAIGAQRSFVVGLFLAETGLTSLLGSVVGTAAAALFLALLKHNGIGAANDVMAFLFSGPRLYPNLHWALLLIAPIGVSGIAVAAAVFATRHAAEIKPAQAMQEKE